MAIKYKIEIERTGDGPRPWEWRIYATNQELPWPEEPDVVGSKRSPQDALDEADITLGLPDKDEA
jgi:hypothetical protein